MGTNHSLQSQPHIARAIIALSKPFYYAGEPIQGTIHVQCLQPNQYKLLVLTFTGEEEYTTRTAHTRAGPHRTTTRSNLCENTQIVADFPQGLNPGSYSYNFSIPTSTDLPGTCEIDRGITTHVRYELKGGWCTHNGQTILDSTIPVKIRETLLTVPRPVVDVLGPSLSGCFCCYTTKQLTISLPSNVYKQGDTLPVTVRVINLQPNQCICIFIVEFVTFSNIANSTQRKQLLPHPGATEFAETVVFQIPPDASTTNKARLVDMGSKVHCGLITNCCFQRALETIIPIIVVEADRPANYPNSAGFSNPRLMGMNGNYQAGGAWESQTALFRNQFGQYP